MLATATTAASGPLPSSSTASSASPLSIKSKSAWAKGPPRLLSTSSPITHNGIDSPFTPSASTSTSDAILSASGASLASPTELEPLSPSSPADPPPRPLRNPARKPSIAGVGTDTVPILRKRRSTSPGAGANARGRSTTGDNTPTASSSSSGSAIFTPSPSTPKWNSLLSHSKPAPPVSTSTPPVLTESKSRSQSRTREQGGSTPADSPVPTVPMLPPLPAYPPPLPPAVKSTLQPDAAPFIPMPLPKRKSAAIVIKRPNGEEVDFKRLANVASPAGTSGGPAHSTAPAPSTAIKIESEAERCRRLKLQSEELGIGSDPSDGENHGAMPVTEEPESIEPDTVGEEFEESYARHEDVDLRSPTTVAEESVDGEKSPIQAPSVGQESANDEETEEWSGQQLAIPLLATSPPTAPLDSGFPTTASAPPQREKRERSRRSSNRQEDLTPGDGEVGLKKMTRTRSGRGGGNRGAGGGDGMTRTRSGAGEPRRRQTPGRLDLSGIPKPSALNTGLVSDATSNAQMIPDVRKVVYPEQDGIFGPLKELNEGVEDGKFRYDRDFLLQFRGLCNERPHGMAELEEIGLEPAEQPAPTRSGRRRRSVRSNTDGTLSTPIVTTVDGTTLAVPGTPLTASATEERFPIWIPMVGPSINPSLPPPTSMNRTGSRGGRSRNSPGGAKLSINISSTLPPPAFPMTRSISHGSSRAPSSATGSTTIMSPSLPPPTPLDRRSKSLRVRKRSSSTRTEQPSFPGSLRSPHAAGPLTPGLMNFMGDVKALDISANRWAPSSLVSRTGLLGRTAMSGSSSVAELESPEMVEKKVKGLLNKLTMEKFDAISDQIVMWANKSEAETDGQTLTLVIKLVFDKATDEATWSTMYAKLCRKMMEKISMDITDENVNDKEGQPIAGGQLFRQYLLSRCQADFERGWSARETLEEQQSAAVAASGAAPGEIVFSDEYYALQKAKRRGLGLVKFIGELFKLQMLTERIMHRCILKLLDEPAEEDIESVCQLLKTVGGALSGPKGRESMDMYFGKMNSLSQDLQVSQRIRFMLLDVIDLRARNWVPKTQVAAPSTLAQVHEAAAKEASEKTSASKPIPILKASSRRGQNRSDINSQKDGDGWANSVGPLGRSVSKTSGASLASTLGSMGVMGDLSKSPTTAKSPSSSSNMFHSLARLSSEPGTSRMTRMPSEPGKSRSRRGGEANRQVNRRTSVDFAHLDAAVDSGNAGRKRLQLLPRSVAAVSSPTEENILDMPPLAATVEEPPSMTEAQAKAKIDEDVKEFMQIRDLNEATGYFESLPSDFRHLLIDRFVSKMDAKESEVSLIAELFSRIATSGVCTAEVFEQGFAPTVEALDDISLDVPSAYVVMAGLLRASRLPKEAVDRLAGLINIYGAPIAHPKDKLLRAFDGAT